ncbi:MAG TPA: NAD(+) synthase [Thermotogota bacterium]|nr:NAD(+) synthase [Thermotogota bacterium]HPJ87976.1 NAD(+) synthase [Thermotogota bacterium]HPR95063.1 NAD(+) synthase [Thermotogota bacterium]
MKERCVEFIRRVISDYHYDGCLIGISGGIDSAVVAALCVEAVGREKVFGLLLPERDSAANTVSDAILVCDSLGINYKIKSIRKTVRSIGGYALKPPTLLIPRKIQEKYVQDKWKELETTDAYIDDLEARGNREFRDGLAFYRVKHRIRMCALYLEAEQRNFAVVGTTNRTEMDTGFYVKWGDDSVDIEPIMHLYKTEVFELARQMHVPDKIIAKPPSPDLIPGITDEFAMKISYADLDRILRKINENQSLEDEPEKEVQRVRTIIEAARGRIIKNLNMME